MADDRSKQIEALLQEVARLRAQEQTELAQQGSGAVARDSGVAGGERAVVVGQDATGNIFVTGNGAQIVIGEQPIRLTTVQRESTLGRYLSYVISRNRYLQLQGIRSGGRLVNIELEHIYITLRATRTRSLAAEEAWLAAARQLAPGEGDKLQREPQTETVTIKVQEAMGEHNNLVILGDPGSGKTTLLRYLALCYGRDCAEDTTLVQERLELNESGHLPLLFPLRNLGAYLKTHHTAPDGTEGYGRLLDFVRAYLQGDNLALPEQDFEAELAAGRVVLFFDGMDEVGDGDLRRRVARLIEAFASACPACRIVVTSRLVGYTGAARLGDGFVTTAIRDFTLADVEQFLRHWHRLVAIGQMGPGEATEQVAVTQTTHLLEAIRTNQRVRELAINPLMLTVIALVHRDRIKLPERRAELYAEAVDVLLGKWDEARGVEELRILEERPFDVTDRRLLLQSIALAMHEAGQKDIAADELHRHVRQAFVGKTAEPEHATERFLTVVQERTGLLVEAGQGVYRFSHLTFQEYLAALQMAEREDATAYILEHTGEPFWREAIVLAAGYLSTRNATRTTGLITALAEKVEEPELFHNLVLAAECLRDVGSARVDGALVERLNQCLQAELERPVPPVPRGRIAGFLGTLTGAATRRREVIRRRVAAVTALSRIESGQFRGSREYWSLPHGEPQWVTVPAGEFWMGSGDSDSEAFSNEKPLHRLAVSEFQMARTPITNAQYLLYVQATGAAAPGGWDDGQPPKDKLEHPVVYVSWHDAAGYCAWLSTVTGKTVALPTEAEWEKAARGNQDSRRYPWGDVFDSMKCNSAALDFNDTTPVGIFVAGASPYGCLDMAGNVWEWTGSLWGEDVMQPAFAYPYNPDDGRENLQAADAVRRVLRGGAFWSDRLSVRCAYRCWVDARVVNDGVGFRVVVRP